MKLVVLLCIAVVGGLVVSHGILLRLNDSVSDSDKRIIDYTIVYMIWPMGGIN